MASFCLCNLIRSIFSIQGLTILFSILFLFILLGIVILRMIMNKYPKITIFNSERYFLDPRSGDRQPLPQLGTILLSKPNDVTYEDIAPSTLYLSVIVPAYNEESRLPIMLDEAFDYLESRKFKYELIVVDDGSSDRTTEIALDYVQKFGSEKIRVITLEKNRGKGGAIRIGILAARGEMCLFADADGATKFSDITKLEKYYVEEKQKCKESEDKQPFNPKQYPIAIGSRAHLQNDSIAKRSFFRTILMYGFHFIVWLLTVRTVKDTQCGFKLMPRRIAHILFTHLHVERWAFDVELLVLAEHLRVPIGEVAVRWTEIEGSKLVPVLSWLQMGKDVALIFALYASGAYSYPKPPFKLIPSLSKLSITNKND